MKIAVKSKAEPQQTLRLRVPQSLKEHMDTTRKLADECGVDWNATMVEAIARFATDLHSQLAQSRSKTVPKASIKLVLAMVQGVPQICLLTRLNLVLPAARSAIPSWVLRWSSNASVR